MERDLQRVEVERAVQKLEIEATDWLGIDAEDFLPPIVFI